MLGWLTVLFLFILPASAEKSVLESFDEKAFSTDDKRLESYRFTYLPTFDKPCLFRLNVQSEDSGTLTIKRLSGKGGYELGKLELNKSVPLSGESFQSLLKKLRDPKVWKPFGEHPERAEMLMGTDGENWTLEAFRTGINNKVKVHNPVGVLNFQRLYALQNLPQPNGHIEDMNPFFQACYSLLQTGNLHFIWNRGRQSDPFTLRKASARFQSPSFRKALEILESQTPADPDNPFQSPIIPTPEERIKAHEFLEKAFKECPDNPQPLISLAYSKLKIGDYSTAEKEINKARKMAPKDLEILYLQGLIWANLRRFPEALEIRDRLKALDPQLSKYLDEEISRILNKK